MSNVPFSQDSHTTVSFKTYEKTIAMQIADNYFRKVNFKVYNTQVTELIGFLSQEPSVSDIHCRWRSESRKV